MKKCPECDSQKIISDAKMIERGDGNASYFIRVGIDEKPDALFFKQRIHSEVKANVCADCGYIHLYAEDPKTLWSAYQNRQNNV